MDDYYMPSQQPPKPDPSNTVYPSTNPNVYNYYGTPTQVTTTSIWVKIIKYLVAGILVALAAFYLGKGKLSNNDVIILGIIAIIIFVVLDAIVPTIQTI
jgi:hypothetical protein